MDPYCYDCNSYRSNCHCDNNTENKNILLQKENEKLRKQIFELQKSLLKAKFDLDSLANWVETGRTLY